jgi:NADH-quinone oxidoreductase subunit G
MEGLVFMLFPLSSLQALAAKNAGVYFDSRSKLEVIKTLQDQGVDAVRSVHPWALINELDDEKGNYSIGYNTKGDFTLSALGNGDLDMPSINQQEGTLTSINKRVNPTNAALSYGGYELNDIANELGLKACNVIDYTKELPTSVGFKTVEFDELPNHWENDGTEVRGYLLENVKVKRSTSQSVEFYNDTKMQGDIIYLANPVRQFTEFTNKATNLDEVAGLYMSEEFLSSSDFNEGDSVKVKSECGELITTIVSDNKIAGNIAVLPTFDSKLNSEALFSGYRFNTASIQKV